MVPNPLPPDISIAAGLVGVSYAFIIPSFITTALRVYVRARARLLGVDDYLIAIATMFAIVLAGLSIEAVRHGKGRHQYYLTKEQIKAIAMYSWIAQLFLFSAICLIKMSICFLFLRVKNTKALKTVLYTIMAVMFITTLECIIVLMIECKPMTGFWDRAHGKCRGPALRIYSIYVQACMFFYHLLVPYCIAIDNNY
jgi:MFS family permease